MVNLNRLTVSITVNTTVTDSATLMTTKKFQTMEGFGGFGAKDVYWSKRAIYQH